MQPVEPSFTIGLEEEYLLVDRQSRDLAAEPSPDLLEACAKRLHKQVSPEFLRCQIEVGTTVCETADAARQQLLTLRHCIAEEAAKFDLAPIAASTHPFGDWDRLRHTDKERYNVLAKDLEMVVRRLVICGMHVHVAIEDDALRIDLFNQLGYFLPHLLALSTSSPFWRGKRSGLKSYRLSVFDEMPRTGIPETFDSVGEFDRTVNVLVKAGLVEDATKIWWDLRPSVRFPTLELRITDVCTRLEDAITIAVVFRCLCRMLYRLRLNNQKWRQYSGFLIRENRWLAQRHGVHGQLVDFGRGVLVPYGDLIDELIVLLRQDAEFFDCLAELEHARTIVDRGTSADRQLAAYEAALKDGADEGLAFRAVVDHLISETLAER